MDSVVYTYYVGEVNFVIINKNDKYDGKCRFKIVESL